MITVGTSWTFLVIVIEITLQKYTFYLADYIKIAYFKVHKIPLPNLSNMCMIFIYYNVEKLNLRIRIIVFAYILVFLDWIYNEWQKMTNIETSELSVNIAWIDRRTIQPRYKMRYEVDRRTIMNNNNNLWDWIKAFGKVGD